MWRPSEGRISVSCGLCLLLIWFGAVNGWRPLAAILTAACVHEGGHIAALSATGGTVQGARLTVLGAVLEIDSTRLSYPRELICVLAGPAANLLLSFILHHFFNDRYASLVGASLSLCVFNLLPIRPLDGGRALYLAICARFGPATGEAAARIVGTVCAGVMVLGLTALMWMSGGNLWLLPAAVCFVGLILRECRCETSHSVQKMW